MKDHVKVVYVLGNQKYTFWAKKGTSLREALIIEGFSPYTKYTQNKNCGGLGVCATCGVWIQGKEPEPTHWHDKIAKKHGYPRLSCQIKLNADIIVEAVAGKALWGLRDMRERKKSK
ncbi:MAG: (2Fe-2S)-binding protein [Bacteroidota bacterium]